MKVLAQFRYWWTKRKEDVVCSSAVRYSRVVLDQWISLAGVAFLLGKCLRDFDGLQGSGKAL